MFRTRHKVHHGKYVYALRNAKGQIKDIQNIGRATRADAKRKARYHPKKSGQGFMGDYLRM